MTTRRGLFGLLAGAAAIPMLPKAALAAPQKSIVFVGDSITEACSFEPYTYLWTMGDKVLSTKPTLDGITIDEPRDDMVLTLTVTDSRGLTQQTNIGVSVGQRDYDFDDDVRLAT